MKFDVELVRRYYEHNTRAFVSFGQGGAVGAMHRAVNGPGVMTQAASFRYVEDLIAGVARALAKPRDVLHVVDLGCGVGGSLCYLAEQLDLRGVGVTLSPTQARLATERIASAGLSGQLSVIVADFADLSALPRDAMPADLAFAIESFVHAPEPDRFFAESSRIIRPGGVLILCDDFRRGVTHEPATRTIERFRRGWHVNTLLEPSDVRHLAARHGFNHDSTIDLTPFVEIGRARDRVIDLVLPLLERVRWRWPRLNAWIGGSALQQALRHGWLGYDFVVFRRATDD